MEWRETSEVQLHDIVHSPLDGVAINSAADVSVISSSDNNYMKYSAIKYPSYFAMITVQVAVVTVLSVLSYANSQGIMQLYVFCVMHDFFTGYVSLIAMHIGVSLKLGGSNITNDSYVNIDSIGMGGNALLCQTDKQFCCGGKYQIGEWYFPNASKVEMLSVANVTSRSYFYRNRGKQIVRLNRVMNPPERGRFFCKVPDSGNVIQTIYVNIGKNEY